MMVPVMLVGNGVPLEESLKTASSFPVGSVIRERAGSDRHAIAAVENRAATAVSVVEANVVLGERAQSDGQNTVCGIANGATTLAAIVIKSAAGNGSSSAAANSATIGAAAC